MTPNEFPAGLTAKENNTLIKEYQLTHNEELKQKLILGNMRLTSHFIKLHGQPFLNCVCTGYPTYEDLNQIAIFEIIECIEKFDTNRGIAFSSYYTRALKNRFLELARHNKHKSCELHYDNPILSDEEDGGLTFLDQIEDKSMTPENFERKIEFGFFKSEILPYLDFREQFVLWQYYVNHKTQLEIAKMTNLTRSYICRILFNATKKAVEFCNNGVDEVSKKLRGVALPFGCYNKFVSSCNIIKQHGEEFLRDVYLPSLSPINKLIFQNNVLYYAGQTAEQISEDSGLPLSYLQKNFDGKICGEKSSSPNPRQGKIDKVKAIVSRHGGAPFLAKYFLPTLGLEQRRAFIFGILQFQGQITKETSDFAKQTLPEFKENLEKSLSQLKKTDFKSIVMKDILGQPQQN